MKVVIAGFGVEGRASYEYYSGLGHDVSIADQREFVENLPEGAHAIFGHDAFKSLNDSDLIVRAPSINPKFLPYGDKVWSATNEFFEKCPTRRIIGVTGTKGKGTTSSLIASILRTAGETVHLVGNIGVPALAELPNIHDDHVVVFELSSFQLWDVQKSPHIAVVLMIEADHLDVHDGMQDYIDAKANIVRFQSEADTVVFNQLNELSKQVADRAVSHKVPYLNAEQFEGYAEAVRLPGAHNLENAQAAVEAVREYVTDPAIIKKGLSAFEGLPHRLMFVAEKNGVKYYDDSIATTPGSAIAAIRSFTESKILILGGYDKGGDYIELIQLCAETDTKVVAIGQNGDDINELCVQLGVVCVREPGTMLAAVMEARDMATSSSVVVLSPAAASFDMFENYVMRGEAFIAAVNSL